MVDTGISNGFHQKKAVSKIHESCRFSELRHWYLCGPSFVPFLGSLGSFSHCIFELPSRFKILQVVSYIATVVMTVK